MRKTAAALESGGFLKFSVKTALRKVISETTAFSEKATEENQQKIVFQN